MGELLTLEEETLKYSYFHPYVKKCHFKLSSFQNKQGKFAKKKVSKSHIKIYHKKSSGISFKK